MEGEADSWDFGVGMRKLFFFLSLFIYKYFEYELFYVLRN